MRKPWPQEVNDWLAENVPGRTTREVTELINRQGFDKRYGMTFTENMVKGAKNRLHIRSGTPGGLPKGSSLLYPEGMEAYVRSIAAGRKTDEIARMVSEHFGIEFTARQCRAYKKNHGIKSGVDCRFVKGQEPPNKGKPMTPEQYEKARPTMFKKRKHPSQSHECRRHFQNNRRLPDQKGAGRWNTARALGFSASTCLGRTQRTNPRGENGLFPGWKQRQQRHQQSCTG